MAGRMAGRWVDVGEAARELGISTDAVRKRIARGSLESDRPDGNVLVWLDESVTETGREAQVEGNGALVEVLTDQVAYLRDQLDQEREARRRADMIIAQLTQATSNLTDRLRELEAPAQPPTPSQASEEAAQEPAEAAPGPASPRPAAEDAQEAAQRPWYRRWFGG